MDAVDEALVVRIGMDRRHHAADDAEFPGEDLGDRRQAVRRARAVGNDAVLFRIVRFFIDAHDDRLIRILARCRDDDPLCAAGQVLRRRFAVFELTRRFDDDVDAQFLPGNIGRIRVVRDGDAAAVDNQLALCFIIGYIVIPATVDGVEFQEIRHDGTYGTIIDSCDFNFRLQQGRTERAAANPAKTADTYFYCHVFFLLADNRGSCA